MATGDIYQINMVITDNGISKQFRSGFQVRQDGASFDFNEIGDRCKEFWNDVVASAAIKAYYDADIELTQVEARRVKPLEDVVQVYTTGLPIAGTSTTDKLPQEVAVLLSHRTQFVGRSKRGRTYLPAPNEGTNEAAGWWALAFIQDVVDAWVLSIGTLGEIGVLLPQVVFSKVLNDGFEVIQTKGDRRARSQRRRNIKTPAYIAAS